MFPVWGKPVIGIAATLNDVIVGAAEALAEKPTAARLSTAIQVDVLRDATLLIMDLPFCSTECRGVHKRPAVAKRIRQPVWATSVWPINQPHMADAVPLAGRGADLDPPARVHL
jgi:hypothetical protein